MNDVFIDIFRDLESKALHFYASLRGMFIAFRLEYLGKVSSVLVLCILREYQVYITEHVIFIFVPLLPLPGRTIPSD